MPENCALMGATRPAEKCSCYLVELVFFSFIIPMRDASPPLVLAFLQAPNYSVNLLP